jgi:methylmalonyl-CoA mutase, N-terminal domain
VENKDHVVVGVNDFIAEDQRHIPTLRIDPQIERAQVARLKALRAKRDAVKTKTALVELERRSGTAQNLLPAILDAVEAYATVGEISDAMRRIYGEYHESVVI